MEYVTTSLKKLCFGDSEIPESSLSVIVKTFDDNIYEYKGDNNEQTIKLYYNLLSQVDICKRRNTYKTTISLEGSSGRTMYFSTFKKLF